MTLIVGNPGETDEDTMATLDLIYEMDAEVGCVSDPINLHSAA